MLATAGLAPIVIKLLHNVDLGLGMLWTYLKYTHRLTGTAVVLCHATSWQALSLTQSSSLGISFFGQLLISKAAAEFTATNTRLLGYQKRLRLPPHAADQS